MIIVSGHLAVDPPERDAYLGRVNVLEVWAGQEQLDRFRGSGPSPDQQAALREVAVREWEVEAR
ncbi:hypothetical protein [Nocardioides nanhaiensis]|uniref:Uncharacterized protein n=1 Tax=Nocardioides nanhaiensis TaxID=1476871 RepID=A0ABP8WYU2_9ACTN